MSDLLAWMLSVFGFTYIVIYSKICKPFRVWCQLKSDFLGELLKCPLCLGFWVGLPAHFLCGSPTHSLLFDLTLASISSWMGTLLIAKMQAEFEAGYPQKSLSVRNSCVGCASSLTPTSAVSDGSDSESSV